MTCRQNPLGMRGPHCPFYHLMIMTAQVSIRMLAQVPLQALEALLVDSTCDEL